jgi:Xaa-Pro aminopeptidase
MESYFTSEFFAANRQRLRDLFTGTAPIVLTANGLLQRNADTTFPFRQDSSFWYLTGIDEPDIILVMDKQREYLIVPSRTDTRSAFDGAINVQALGERSGVTEILDEVNGWKQLEARLKKVQHVATLSPAKSYISEHGMYTNPARRRLVSRIKAHNSMIELLDIRPHVTRLRTIKQPQELAAIQAAIDLTESTLKSVRRRLASFAFEHEIEADITAAFRRRNARHAYQPIIAADANAVTLHYISNNSPLSQKSLVLMDVGAEVENYAADITRTYALRPTKRQQQVASAVLEVQEFAKEQLRPGTTLHEYEAKIELFMGEKLRELGLIQSIEKSSVRQFYPHATSHFLGLDVHDAADYERPLEPGMVLTVEPGIYIPNEAIGIRIEDNVLITKAAPKVLSKRLPRDLA